ncbi:hypothetical protein TO73_1896 [Thermus aquaticus Y51MC23]|uniref:Uncharacterized protein n=1 Tax=Thermus aquaticus (strain ATCC BAA-2747 / Y51MC23) TaxID=498848 RepID=A0ABM5VNS6_THEA5|nr:hypothetical protein TO73_1896 [Thermus aquaticus Y51MC23]
MQKDFLVPPGHPAEEVDVLFILAHTARYYPKTPGPRSLMARTLVLQHGVPESGLWRGFSGAPTAAFAAVGCAP